MTRARLNIFIEPDHAKRLDQVAAHKGVSKSAVIAAAQIADTTAVVELRLVENRAFLCRNTCGASERNRKEHNT